MKTLIRICLITCFAATLWSCEKMQDNYKKYVVPGGVMYPESPKNPEVYPGYYRVEIVWEKGNDPSITRALVTWDNGVGSKEFTVDLSGDHVTLNLDGLEERNYSFVVRTLNADGQSSVPVELNTFVYGDYYTGSIYNRTLEFAYTDTEHKLNLTWSGADMSSGMLYTDMSYETIAGTTETVRIEAKSDSETMVIDDYKMGSEIAYQSFFLPEENSIDTFTSSEATVLPAEFLDRSTWEIRAKSEEASGQLAYGGGPASYLLDGLTVLAPATGQMTATYWHSQVAGSPGFPYWFVINMQQPTEVNAIMLQRRSDMHGGTSFCFTEFSVLVGNDDECWTSDTTDKWIELGDNSIYDTTGTAPQYYRVSAESEYRYLKVILKNGSGTHGHLAELGVLGRQP